jgi:putative Ca2+/H+ antiporter (TMEM165/GDT1 family)
MPAVPSGLQEAFTSKPAGRSDSGSGTSVSSSSDDDLQAAAAAVAAAEGGRSGGGAGAAAAPARRSVWREVLEVASLVFAAEFGDRSCLSVVAMAATPGLSPAAVGGGALAAHAAAGVIAVVGGAMAGRRVSERALNAVSGVVLLLFAAAALIAG